MGFKDLAGQRFGRLVAVERVGTAKSSRHPLWLCQCDCGNTTIVVSNNLTRKNGHTRSCGCLNREYSTEASKNARSHPTHGRYGPRLYKAWGNMKARCYRPSYLSYPNYGGRGITVCDEWRHDFVAFRDWAMSHGYQDGLFLDRIDLDEPYAPDNCRWITRRQQISERNKRKARERRERIVSQRNDYAPLPLRLLRYGSYGKED